MISLPETPARHALGVAAALMATIAVAGCQGSHAKAAPASTVVTTTTTLPSTTPTPSPSPTIQPVKPIAYVPPPYTWSTATVTAAELGKSWHSGCPIGPASLRTLSLRYWGFDGRAHMGALVVTTRAVPAVAAAFRSIYNARFPIRRMIPIAAYGGDDNKSMAADNTSAFNCRYAVADGPKRWSLHAYGEAIDIDTIENPYTLDGRVYPPAGKPYTNRSNVRPGMIVPGSAPVRAFSSVGWGWGARFRDYQHFSSSGQ
jgi:hypothetical protein